METALDELVQLARHSARTGDDRIAARALRALAELDARLAQVLAAEIYGNHTAWIGAAWRDEPEPSR